MTITMQGKYQTRDGRPVRILCVDGPMPTHPVIALIEHYEKPFCWSSEGYACPDGSEQDWDLVPVPTKHEGWMIVNSWGQPIGSDIYNTETFAKQDPYCGASGCYAVRVVWEAYA